MRKHSPAVLLVLLSIGLMLGGCQAPIEEEQELSSSELSEGAMTAPIFGTRGLGLNVRAEATTASAVVGGVSDGQRVTILCQEKGQFVDGTDVWDRIDNPRGYVNDAYVRTGVNGFHSEIARCNGSNNGGGSASATTAPPQTTSSRGFTAIWGNVSSSITQGYAVSSGLPYYEYGVAYGLDGTQHTGIDVGIPDGTTLYTPKAGTVVCVGGRGSSPDGSSCGFFGDSDGGVGRIQISLDDGSQLILGHCSTSTVNPGDKVSAGQKVGTSGAMNGPHVHVEMRVKGGNTSSGWRTVDPRTML